MPKRKATAMEKVPGMSQRGAGMLTKIGFKLPKDLDGKDVLEEWKKAEGGYRSKEDKLLLLNSLRAASDFSKRGGKDAAKRKGFVRELYKMPGITELTAVALYESGKNDAKAAIKELLTMDVNKVFDDIVSKKHLSMLEATEVYFSLVAAHFMANQDESKRKLAVPGPWGKIDGP